MTTALLLVGHGRYEDPWHDLAATSHALAGLLAGVGLDVVVRGTFPDALDRAARPDLLVVDAGRGRSDAGYDGDDAAWRAFHDRRAAWVAGGVPVLAVHQSANTFGDDPRWAAELGGRWVEGRSWHPEHGRAAFRVVDPAHPVADGLPGAVEVADERYADLEVAPGNAVVVAADITRDEAGERPGSAGAHPVVWTRGRVVYSALGHDERPYADPSYRRLVTNATGWLLRR